MTQVPDKYVVDGVDMSSLRNRNESRVADCMREELATMIDNAFTEKDLLDVYALSLNMLPARYTQKGTIVLREPVSKDSVRAIVRNAFEQVLQHPKD